MRALVTASLLALLAALPASAATRIGVTMTAFDNPWLTLIRQGMEARAKTLGDVELQVEDAQLDVGKQTAQVENFIAGGVDAIIVNVVDGSSATAINKLATDAKIPLVYVNHPPADAADLPEGVSFVGSDEVESGTMQTEAVCKMLGGKGNVLVLVGPLENESAIVRTKDIHDVLSTDACKGMTVVDEKPANWSRDEAQTLMTNWLTTGQQFDAVIANNDEMAIGAILAMKAAGVDMGKVVVAGIDATPDGLAAMKAGDLDVTVFQNAAAQAAQAVDAAVAMAKGEKTERTIWVPFEAVTPENMATYAK